MTRRLSAVLWLAMLFGTAPEFRAQQSTFRAFADAVSVDVSVKTGRVPVAGLTTADFEVRDNGVAQQLDAVSIEAVPIDVTLAVDLSGSVVPNVKAFKSDVEKFVAMLRPADRVRIVSFSSDVREDVPMQQPTGVLRTDWTDMGGATALNDGLLYALLWPETPDRRHLVIAFTDGMDTYSTVPNESIPAIAGRVEAVLHAVLVQPSGPRVDLYQGSLDALREAARRTGGETHRLSRAIDDFTQIVADFRASYVLRYTPKGVDRGGWHTLAVRVTRPGAFNVRARAGYTGG
jgi:VWFA-related protein